MARILYFTKLINLKKTMHIMAFFALCTVIMLVGAQGDLPLVLKKETYPITLQTEEGLVRKGVLSIHARAKGNIVLCHPAAYDKNFMIPFDEQVFAEYNCIRFDFRRHGEDSDKDHRGQVQYSSLGADEVAEVRAAVKFFKNHHQTKHLPVYGFGISMGAAALIETESKTPLFDGLILQSSFEKLRTQIKRTHGFYRTPLMHNFIFRPPTTTIARAKYRVRLEKTLWPAESIKKIEVPIFLIHAKNDKFIDFEAFESLHKSTSGKAHSWTPEDGEHTKIFAKQPEEFTKKCTEFLGHCHTVVLAKAQQAKTAIGERPVLTAQASTRSTPLQIRKT